MISFLDSKIFTRLILIIVSTEYSTFLLDDGTPALTLRTIGGIIDLHMFLGPNPEDLNTQYATVSISMLLQVLFIH